VLSGDDRKGEGEVKNISGMWTKKEAEAAGFVVDTCCYPWIAYRGPRFDPTEHKEILTDIEAELAEKVLGAIKRGPDGYALVMDTGNFVGAWRSRETAEKLRGRSPLSKNEVVRPFVFVEE